MTLTRYLIVIVIQVNINNANQVKLNIFTNIFTNEIVCVTVIQYFVVKRVFYFHSSVKIEIK